MIKTNFKCPKCKKGLIVGKRLRADYKCPNCGYAMIITKEEKNQGHKNYIKSTTSSK